MQSKTREKLTLAIWKQKNPYCRYKHEVKYKNWKMLISSGSCLWSSPEYGCSNSCAWTCLPLIWTCRLVSHPKLSPTWPWWTPLKTVPKPSLFLHGEQQDRNFVCMDNALSSLTATLSLGLSSSWGSQPLLLPNKIISPNVAIRWSI